MITQSSIDRVNEVELIEVIQRLNVKDFKKAGSTWKGLSPFTNEKSPSFMASPSKNVWKCFSSGKGGVGPVSFVMAVEGLPWIEAIERVASVAGIILEKVEQTQQELEQFNQDEELRKLLLAGNLKFKKHFAALPEEHWARQNLLARGYSQETLDQFEIGFANENSNDITSPLKEQGRLGDGILVGLVKEKEQRTYDFFNRRLMFPVLDDRGRPIAFGGRASNEAMAENPNLPKYLNSPDTKFYNKKTVLYGYFQARAAMVKKNYCFLVEGYTDVMGFHDKSVANTIATCGTALTPEHARKIKKACAHVILVRDGDAAGQKAALRDIDICLAENLKVSVVELPKDEDPDTISKAHPEDLEDWLLANTENALYWKAACLKKSCTSPEEKSEAVDAIIESLIKIKDNPVKRKAYVIDCAKILGVGSKELKQALEDKLIAAKEKKSKVSQIYADEKAELVAFGFPADGDVAQFKRDGYVISREQVCIFFESAQQTFFKGTNFIVNPLFSIRSGKGEARRLIEFTNHVGENTVFSLNNKEINSFGLFQEAILNGWNFTFEPNINNKQFLQFRNRLLYNFEPAYELYTLGQQPEGFFAFANGVVFNNDFFPVDEYGIVNVEIPEDEENKKPAINRTFYSPAYSKLNLAERGDEDDAFEGVREFAYKESDLTFNQWMHAFCQVYEPEKAMVGVAFMIAALFRDIIVNQFSSFPHLFLTGQRQSGKTKYSESLTFLFAPGQKSFDLNTGTPVGFFRRVSKIKNIIVGLEEYTDIIHEVKFQTLKAAYDNRGRETGSISGGEKGTTLTKVQSACIILSQYLSTRDDNSLTSRSIPLSFVERNYSPDEKQRFGRLKAFERKGMTSILVEVLKYRSLIESSLAVTIEELNRELVKEIKGDMMERMLDNFVAIMAPVKLLYNKFAFPFSWAEFKKVCVEMIMSASSLIHETESTASFWRTLEYLVDQRRIQEGREFKIEPKPEFKYKPAKGEVTTYVNPQADKILFLRLGKVHQDYVETISKRKNEEPIGEATLRSYFLAKSYYIGHVPAMHFDTGSGSAYAFNYTKMFEEGVINLEREFKNHAPAPPGMNGHPHPEAANVASAGVAGGRDDLPF